MIRQILLHLPTYPDRTPLQGLESAAFLAQQLGARITAQIPQLSDDPKSWPPVIGTFPLDFPQMMNEAVAISQANAANLAKDVVEACASFNVALDMRRGLTTFLGAPDALVDLGRLHDLTVMSLPTLDSFAHDVIQTAIFGTGHPTLLLPSGNGARPLRKLGKVLVAWDYSREAARTMADALPILARAKEVHILSVFGEKGLKTNCVASDLEKYLAAHKVQHQIDQVTIKDGTIGDCLLSHASEIKADLLVMGAFGHSRLREFVLGGATRTILSESRLPVFLSH